MSGALGGLIRRYHPLVWSVVALHLVAALAFTLLVPAFRSPDEAQHVDMIRRYRAGLGHDAPDQMVPMAADVDAVNRAVADPAVLPRPPLLAEDVAPRPVRPAFDDVAPPGATSGVDNQLTQHPPAYYALVAGGTTLAAGMTPEGWWSWDRELFLYRLVSVLLTAALPLLAAEAAMATGLSRRAGAVAAAVVLLVPQATVVGSAVNNDALVMLGAAVAVTAALHHVRTSRHTSAWVAAGAGAVAALTKATAAPLLAWVVLVVVVTAWGRWRESEARSSLVGTAAIGALGATWYVRNLVRYDDIQPSGYRAPRAEGFEPSLRGFVPQWSDLLSRTFWGMPARRTGVFLPAAISHGLSAGAVALALVALGDAARRRATALLLLLTASQVALLAQSNWRSHGRTGAFPAVQGRYLFAVLVPLAVICVIGARQLGSWWPSRLRRPRPDTATVAAVVAAAGAVLHLWLAVSMLQGFWGAERASLHDRLLAVVAWSPLPALLTWLVLGTLATGTVVMAVFAVSRVLRWALRGRSAVPAPDPGSPRRPTPV